MGSINPGVNVSGMPGYPNITEAYAQTFAKQKELKPEIWVSSHAGHFGLHEKYKPRRCVRSKTVYRPRRISRQN
jgi:metallo-beta-lactamase class B